MTAIEHDRDGASDPRADEDEAEAIAASASRARTADRELAIAPRRLEPHPAPDLDGPARRALLPAGLERELIAAAQDGDPRARARLVEAYMPLIGSLARLYRHSPRVDRVELLQEGAVGLLRALERFDARRGTPFWPYASWWVRQAMQQLVAELTRPAVLSDRALRQLARLKDAHRDAVRTNGRQPTRGELAAATGLPDEQVANLIAIDATPRSTDEPVLGADGAVGTFGELLVDPLAEAEYERVLGAMEARQLLSLLSGLSDRERAILRARGGVDGEPESLRQIGARLGLSAERVRQLEQRARGKLAAAAGEEPAAPAHRGGG